MTGVITSPRRVLVAVSAWEREQFQIDAAFAAIASATAASGAEVQVCEPGGTEAWGALLDRFRPEILVVGWAAPVLPDGYFEVEECPVRHMCFLTGSVRRLVPVSFIARGGVVTNWGDSVAPLVAEHALLLLLASLRRLPEWRPYIERAVERQATHALAVATRTLHGRTVALHGFGQIAREFVRLLAPFGVTVRACSEGVPADFMRRFGVEPLAGLRELFEGAEILVECEALNPQTEKSVTAELLDLLKPGAVFVNVGRGAVVDEAALIAKAARGELQVALDVLAVEPPAVGSPLLEAPGALLSPHIGGPTLDFMPTLGLRAAENVRRRIAGEPLLQPITAEMYERST